QTPRQVALRPGFRAVAYPLRGLDQEPGRLCPAVDGERPRPEAELLAPLAHDPEAQGMEGGDIEVVGRGAQDAAQSIAQLASRAAGEGDRQHAGRPDLTDEDQVGD